MKILAVLSYLLLSAWAAPQVKFGANEASVTSCGLINGQERKVGDIWKSDCNICVCRSSGIATCTLRFCGNIPVLSTSSARIEVQNKEQEVLVDTGTLNTKTEANQGFDRKKSPKPGKRPGKKPRTTCWKCKKVCKGKKKGEKCRRCKKACIKPLEPGTSCATKAASCVFTGEGTGEVVGEVIIEQHEHGEHPHVAYFHGEVAGLAPGLHGFHIHENGDLGDNCKAAGGHFNPDGVNHGGKDAEVRHLGDLGNLEVAEDGIMKIEFGDHIAQLNDPYSIIGKAIVIHEGEDDLGLGGDEGSITTGNAGPRAGCCLIVPMDKSYLYNL